MKISLTNSSLTENSNLLSDSSSSECKVNTNSNEENGNSSKNQKVVKRKRKKQSLYPCTLCKKTFPEHWRLVRHMKERHSKREDAILCTLCGSTLKNKSSLIKHTQAGSCVKARDKPHPCQVCGRRYRSLKYFRQHMREIHPKYPIDSQTKENPSVEVAGPISIVSCLTRKTISSEEEEEKDMLLDDPESCNSMTSIQSGMSGSEDSSTSSATIPLDLESKWDCDSLDVADILKDYSHDAAFFDSSLEDVLLDCVDLTSFEQELDTWSWLVQFN